MSEEKTFKIKQYPLKGINLKEISLEKHMVCTCGHFNFHHTFTDHKRVCDDCLCPNFEYYMDMTFDEHDELRRSRKGDIST